MVPVGSTLVWEDAIHQRGARRTTHRRRTVGMRESRTLAGQLINVRSAGLWMTTQITDPIVQVVHGNEQHVRLFRLGVVRHQLGDDSEGQDRRLEWWLSFHAGYLR